MDRPITMASGCKNQTTDCLPNPESRPTILAVVIGRNEGQRLVRCLASIPDSVKTVVYVDSGSSDNSVANARLAGATVVSLDLDTSFTAARARNAGYQAAKAGPEIDMIQFIDGDCELHKGWIDAGADFLTNNPKTAVVCGRVRERFPEISIYNRLCDKEWDTPIGETKACGGIALFRTAAFAESGGFLEALIAGEEPELCVRLRAKGWKIWRLDHEMTWHDAAMMRFGQWWKRRQRAGHAFAEGAHLHGAPPERHWVKETWRALVWGAFLPLLITLAGIFFSPWAFLGYTIYPLQIARLALRQGADRAAWEYSAFMVIGKFAEVIGVLDFFQQRLRGVRSGLIEYK